jgi:ATP-dependent DNA helicase RecQ
VLTDRSADVLRGDVKVMMRRETAAKARTPRARTATTGPAAPADLPAETMPVFERLRAWRATTAKDQGVPAYVIFHDATLRAIAALHPTTLDQLATVSGVGQGKLTKFGPQVLQTLNGPGTGPEPDPDTDTDTDIDPDEPTFPGLDAGHEPTFLAFDTDEPA